MLTDTNLDQKELLARLEEVRDLVDMLIRDIKSPHDSASAQLRHMLDQVFHDQNPKDSEPGAVLQDDGTYVKTKITPKANWLGIDPKVWARASLDARRKRGSGSVKVAENTYLYYWVDDVVVLKKNDKEGWSIYTQWTGEELATFKQKKDCIEYMKENSK